MGEPEPAARSLTNDWAALLLLGGGAAFAIAAAHLPVLRQIAPACPSHTLLGLPCPGCGLTRACLALAHLDWRSALLFNPLIVIVAPYALYRLGLTICTLLARRRLRPAWPRWWVDRVECAFVALWCLLAAVRLVTFLAPEWNPQGWLMP